MSEQNTNLTDLQNRESATKRRSMKELQALPPKQRVSAFLSDNRKQIAAALPRHVTVDRMLQVAQTAVTQNPRLLECDFSTLVGSLIKCTQLGLEPNNALGQSYLVPFQNRKAQRLDCQLIIGYRGMIDLARRSGSVSSIQAQAVRAGDDFSYEYGLHEHLRHIPGRDRGEITHFYAYAKLTDGGFQFEVLPVNDIVAVMRSTQSKGQYGPWKDHFEQMGRKTMVRRLFNYLPVSIEMAEAAAIDATGETQAQNLDNVIDNVEYSVMDNVGADEPEALEEQSQPDEPRVQQGEPIVDVNGEILDPEIHLVTDSGRPVYNADDSFRKRPQRGKRKDGEHDDNEPAQQQQAAQAQQQEAQQQDDDPDRWGEGVSAPPEAGGERRQQSGVSAPPGSDDMKLD